MVETAIKDDDPRAFAPVDGEATIESILRFHMRDCMAWGDDTVRVTRTLLGMAVEEIERLRKENEILKAADYEALRGDALTE